MDIRFYILFDNMKTLPPISLENQGSTVCISEKTATRIASGYSATLMGTWCYLGNKRAMKHVKVRLVVNTPFHL